METPPFTISSKTLDLLALIAEEVGRLGLSEGDGISTPKLRRENRIKSIHASLAIENNSLSLDQVTALLDGKRVLGPVKEIQEVKNAFNAYESIFDWQPYVVSDLLNAHAKMMNGLIDRPGSFRSGGVGIAKGGTVVHLAPPAGLVPGLINDLLEWLEKTDIHPLISSCVFHYELEFIHPFADGNGRIGRLWQTLILSKWKAPLAFLPVEDVIRKKQLEYYDTLAACDKAGDSSKFIEFILTALLQALRETHVTDQVTDQVKSLLSLLNKGPLSALECMRKLELTHRPTFRENYINPAISSGLIERTIPDKPNSRLQKYRLVKQ